MGSAGAQLHSAYQRVSVLPRRTAPQALGKAPTFGIRDNRSIKDQRESLPIFKLREQLIQAVHDNQVRARRHLRAAHGCGASP